MRLSDYIIDVEFRDGSVALFSTISRALVKVEPTKYEELKCGDYKRSFTDDEISFLASRHILVDEGLNETEYAYVTLMRDRISPKVYSTYLALTTDCNFMCPYCYETGQVTRQLRFTEADLPRVLQMYERILDREHYTSMKVTLYGGEPLLDTDLLKVYVKGLKDLADRRSVTLYFDIITNGYLFDSEKQDFLIENGLVDAQITLDGSKEFHDQRRVLINGSGTYDTIISNVFKAADKGLCVTIRVNFDVSNLSSIPLLLEDLAKCPNKENLSVYFAPVHQTSSQWNDPLSFCSMCSIDGSPEIIDSLCRLYSRLHALGFSIPIYYSCGPCMLIASDAVLIAPSGRLFKCVEMIGKNDLAVGSLESVEYSSYYYHFMAGDRANECIQSSCRFAPICSGGCLVENSIASGRLDQGFKCQKRIIEEVTKHLITLRCDRIE